MSSGWRTLEDTVPRETSRGFYKNLLQDIAAPEDIGGHFAPTGSSSCILCQYSTVDSFCHIWQQKPAGGHGNLGGHIAPTGFGGSISCQYSTVDSFRHVWQQNPAGGHGNPRGHWRTYCPNWLRWLYFLPIFNCGLIPPRLATKPCRRTWQPQRTLEDILPQLAPVALFHANIQLWTHSTTFGNKNLPEDMATPEDIGRYIAPIGSGDFILCQYSTVDSFHHVWQQNPAGGHGSPRGHWRTYCPN